MNNINRLGFGWGNAVISAAKAHRVHDAYGGVELVPGIKATKEHIRPRSYDGTYQELFADDNILPVIESENGRRANRPLQEFLDENPVIVSNIKRNVQELSQVTTAHFNGSKWAPGVIQNLQKEAPKYFSNWTLSE